MSWQPAAELNTLRQRAQLTGQIREFFSARGVLEVDTPLLCSYGVTDPALQSLEVEPPEGSGPGASTRRFLQTSPEYALKRLLAAYPEPIYQLGKAFRAGEAGPRHNPEFTLLEWYRPGFDQHALMDEVAALVCQCLGERHCERISYRALFLDCLGIDPMKAPLVELEAAARAHVELGDLDDDRDMWLDLLMSHVIEPSLAAKGMCFVYDYPASQAALAKIVTAQDVEVAQRFELYVDGLELANGYCELSDPEEQRRRFEQDNNLRRQRELPEQALDEHFLAALEHGLPDCSGVALGVDRLLMLHTGATHIRQVLAFDWDSS